MFRAGLQSPASRTNQKLLNAADVDAVFPSVPVWRRRQRGLSVAAVLEFHWENDQGAKNDENLVSHGATEH